MEEQIILWAGFVGLVLSELIALNPKMKSNSILQLIKNLAFRLSGKK